MNSGVALVLTVTLSPLVGWTAGVWHAHATATRDAAPRRGMPEAQVSLPTNPTPAPEPRVSSPVKAEPSADQDLYGNDVSPAVATYTRDADGATFEEHSPDTEVSSPRSPTT